MNSEMSKVKRMPDKTDRSGDSPRVSLLRSVDSQLAKQSNLSAVSEILNGCMCVKLYPHALIGMFTLAQVLRACRADEIGIIRDPG